MPDINKNKYFRLRLSYELRERELNNNTSDMTRDPRSVVTAAHCQFPVSRFLVVLGEHDLEEDEDTELRMVPASWTSHPLYNPR